MILVYPPAAKSCEPPAGIAKLSGALRSHGISVQLLDANLEGQLHLLSEPMGDTDTWTRRARKNCQANLIALRDLKTYQSTGRYSRAVRDLQRVLAVAGEPYGARAGLSDYQQDGLSPVRSADLVTAAGHPEQNPFYPYFSKRLSEVLEADSSNMIGFSLTYLSQAICTFAMIGFVRKNYPGMKIVIGGGLVTSWIKRPGWKDPFGGLVDHCIAGPGEGPLLELHGQGPTALLPVMPDYRSLPLREYLSPGFILPYSASIGCYWNKCSFCPELAEDNPYIPVPAEKVVADLRSLTAATGPVLIHLLDNAVSPALLRMIAAYPPGAPWYGFARFGQELVDPDFCRALKRSGCVMLKLGLESGAQGVLDKMRKGINLDEAAQVLKNLKNAGIATYVYLLFGTPVETATDARKTLDYVVTHQDTITFLNLAVFNMPLYGEEAALFGDEPFYDGDLSLYASFKHPRGWDRKLVRQFLEREFKKHPAISAIIKRDPPIYTSNHAALFGKP